MNEADICVGMIVSARFCGVWRKCKVVGRITAGEKQALYALIRVEDLKMSLRYAREIRPLIS